MSQYVSFIWPWMLWTTLLAPLLIWLYVHLRKRQQQTAVDLGPVVGSEPFRAGAGP